MTCQKANPAALVTMELTLSLHPVTATNATRDLSPPKSPLKRKQAKWCSVTKTIFKSTNALIAIQRYSPISQEDRKQPWRKWGRANHAVPATTKTKTPSRCRMIAANATKCDHPPHRINRIGALPKMGAYLFCQPRVFNKLAPCTLPMLAFQG